MIVKMISKEELKHLKHEFDLIDDNKDGFLSVEEVQAALGTSHVKLSKDKKINYTEFLVMNLDIKKYATEKRLDKILQNFDRDQKGYITKDDIKFEFKTAGKNVTKSQIKLLMSEYDSDKKGYISYDSFKSMVLNAN
jgi:calcium-dependent protein kinase